MKCQALFSQKTKIYFVMLSATVVTGIKVKRTNPCDNGCIC